MTRTEMVGKAARALFFDNYSTRISWDDAPDHVRQAYIDRAKLALDAALPGETTVEWGVRHSPGELLAVRWCPTYGGNREPVPYTEAEARADSRESGYPVVKRRRTTYEIDDRVTKWESA